MNKKLKSKEFEVEESDNNVIYVVKSKLYVISKSGKSKGRSRKDYYYKIYGFENLKMAKEFEENFETFARLNNFKYICSEENMSIKEFEKEKEKNESLEYEYIRTGEKEEFFPRFKIINEKDINNYKKKETKNIQTCMEGFEEKEFGEILTKEQRYVYLYGNPSSRKSNEKGNALAENNCKFNSFKINEGITKVSSPSSFSFKIAENFAREFGESLKRYNSFDNKRIPIQKFEETLFEKLVLPHLLTVKETEMEPTPFKVCSHLFDTVFGTGKNKAEGFNKIMIKVENELGIKFKDLINDYEKLIINKFRNKENYIIEVRKFIGFKKIKIEIKGRK